MGSLREGQEVEQVPRAGQAGDRAVASLRAGSVELGPEGKTVGSLREG